MLTLIKHFKDDKFTSRDAFAYLKSIDFKPMPDRHTISMEMRKSDMFRRTGSNNKRETIYCAV